MILITAVAASEVPMTTSVEEQECEKNCEHYKLIDIAFILDILTCYSIIQGAHHSTFLYQFL